MVRRFKPIPAKGHKRIKHDRKYTAAPKSYKPKLRKLSTIREAKPTPHKQTFSARKILPMPKSPYKHKHKSEFRLNGVFFLLLLLLLALVGVACYIIKFLL